MLDTARLFNCARRGRLVVICGHSTGAIVTAMRVAPPAVRQESRRAAWVRISPAAGGTQPLPIASPATGPGGGKWHIGVHPHQPSVIHWPPSRVRRHHLLGSLPLRVCAAISVGGVPLAPLDRRCNWLAGTLAEDPFRMGERYTVADPYLFTILDWTSVLAADLGHWPALKHYLARVGARQAVQETLTAEGLTG